MLRITSVLAFITALAPVAALPVHVSLLQTAMKAKRGGVTEMSVLNGERPEKDESCNFASEEMPEFPDDIDDEAMLAQVRLMQTDAVRTHGPSDSLKDDILGDNDLEDDEALGLLDAAMAM
eukprot:TRINITY_DN45049_c0_g1_i1.p2 TRINITY_DN45049_c0_g1~~TRINITY_DN45049_c0_g1_i1.p2  ORF type:complete len:121 (+),score=37.84 TRINITY_DN45049_c0_g1_i1:131-493(+)